MERKPLLSLPGFQEEHGYDVDDVTHVVHELQASNSTRSVYWAREGDLLAKLSADDIQAIDAYVKERGRVRAADLKDFMHSVVLHCKED